MLNKVDFYYFSPTGGTKKAGEILAEAMAEKVMLFDLGSRDAFKEAAGGDVAVVAVPVFGGRVPAVASEKLKALKGNGKKAVTLAIYGNRAYEDALLELNDVMKETGYEIAASAALVAQHSMAPEVGAGRPDEKDAEEIRAFAGKILAKLEKGDAEEIKVPGNHSYKPMSSMPVTPMSLPSCNTCGKCAAVCPTEAIQIENGVVTTEAEKCCLCMACVHACPEGARILPPPLKEKMEQMLGALKGVRRENETFI